METACSAIAAAAALLWPQDQAAVAAATRSKAPGEVLAHAYAARLAHAHGNIDRALAAQHTAHCTVAELLASSTQLELIDHAALAADRATQRSAIDEDSSRAVELLTGLATAATTVLRLGTSGIDLATLSVNDQTLANVAAISSLDRLLVVGSLLPLLGATSPYIMRHNFKTWASLLFTQFIKPRGTTPGASVESTIDSVQGVHRDLHAEHDISVSALIAMLNLLVSSRDIPNVNSKETVTSFLYPTIERVMVFVRASLTDDHRDTKSPRLTANELATLLNTLATTTEAFGATLRPKRAALLSLCADVLRQSSDVCVDDTDTAPEAHITPECSRSEAQLLSSCAMLYVRATEIPLTAADAKTAQGTSYMNLPTTIMRAMLELGAHVRSVLAREPHTMDRSIADVLLPNVDRKTIDSAMVLNSLQRGFIVLDNIIAHTAQRVNVALLLQLADAVHGAVALPGLAAENNRGTTRRGATDRSMPLLLLDADANTVHCALPNVLAATNRSLVAVLRNGTRLPLLQHCTALERACSRSLAARAAGGALRESAYDLLGCCIDQFGASFVALSWRRIVPAVLADIGMDDDDKDTNKNTDTDLNGGSQLTTSTTTTTVRSNTRKNTRRPADRVFSDRDIQNAHVVSRRVQRLALDALAQLLPLAVAPVRGVTQNTVAATVPRETILASVVRAEHRILVVALESLEELTRRQTLRAGSARGGATATATATSSSSLSSSAEHNTIADVADVACAALRAAAALLHAPLARRETAMPVYAALFARVQHSSVEEVRHTARRALAVLDPCIHPLFPRLQCVRLEDAVCGPHVTAHDNTKRMPMPIPTSTENGDRNVDMNGNININGDRSPNTRVVAPTPVVPVVVVPMGSAESVEKHRKRSAQTQIDSNDVANGITNGIVKDVVQDVCLPPREDTHAPKRVRVEEHAAAVAIAVKNMDVAINAAPKIDSNGNDIKNDVENDVGDSDSDGDFPAIVCGSDADSDASSDVA